MMQMTTEISPDVARVHDAAWQTIPWLVNGTLDDDGARALRAHLSTCEACRREVAVQRRLAAAVRDQGPLDGALENAWAAARSGIGETRRGAAAPVPAGTGWQPRAGRLAFAAASCAVLAVAALTMLGPDDAPFRTMTAPAGAEDGLTFRVVLAAGVQPGTLAALFAALDIEDVSGPSPAGVRTMRARTTAAADRAAAALSAHPDILFVAGRPAP